MSRAYRPAPWRLVPDIEAPTVSEMQCGSCPDMMRSPDRAAVEEWARAHSGRHPTHRTFTGRTELGFRTVPAMAEVTPLPVVVGCVACGGTAGVEPVAMVPRASGSDRVLTACSACADEVATRALQELESVERHLGVGRG